MTTCVKHLHGKYGIESADPALQIAYCQINWGFLEIFGKKRIFVMSSNDTTIFRTYTGQQSFLS